MKGLIMRFRTFLVLATVLSAPTFATAEIISDKAFKTCIVPAVTDNSSLENLAVDFSLVPNSVDCAHAITKYGNAHGNLVNASDVTLALVALTRNAIDNGMVPQSGIILIASMEDKVITD